MKLVRPIFLLGMIVLEELGLKSTHPVAIAPGSMGQWMIGSVPGAIATGVVASLILD